MIRLFSAFFIFNKEYDHPYSCRERKCVSKIKHSDKAIA